LIFAKQVEQSQFSSVFDLALKSEVDEEGERKEKDSNCDVISFFLLLTQLRQHSVETFYELKVRREEEEEEEPKGILVLVIYRWWRIFFVRVWFYSIEKILIEEELRTFSVL